MPPSNSRSRTSPEREEIPGPFAPALTVDVEEWYHSCWIPEYNRPDRPAGLPRELDRLLPALGEELDRAGARATLFVLGELAEENAAPLRSLAAAGHEIACHGFHHFRANDLAPAAFLGQIRDAKHRLEDLVGAAVTGFRAPEWSLRTPANPRLKLVAEAGFGYDSSLVRALGAGSDENPSRPVRFRWSDLPKPLWELPPLTWAGAFRLPAGGWCGRLAAPRWILAAVRSAQREGRLPLLVIHPWELVDRPVPGLFTGLARLFHDAGRGGYREKFRALLAGTTWTSVTEVLAENRRRRRIERPLDERTETEAGGLDLARAGATP